LKVGFLVHREWKTQAADYNIMGSFNFNGSYTGDGFADVLVGRAFSFSEVDKVLMPNIVRHTIEAYVDDHWKVSPHFSLDLGVRFTYFGLPTEENGNFRAFIPSLYKASQAPVVLSAGTLAAGTGNPLNGIADPNAYQRDHQKGFAPRIGFAWDPSGKAKFVVRGGYGQFYNR
jgi:outer membrane receptor protein involved in Fe transport